MRLASADFTWPGLRPRFVLDLIAELGLQGASLAYFGGMTERDPQAIATVKAARLTLLALRDPDAPGPVRERLAGDAAAIAGLLDRAASEGLTVTARAEALDPLLPGEAAHVRVSLLNRGLGAATEGELRLAVPGGWTVDPSPAGIGTLAPGASRTVTFTVTPPVDATTGEEVALTATFTYRQLGRAGTARAGTGGTLQPVLTVEPVDGTLPLADGGYNEARVRVVNHASRAIDAAMAAAGVAGIAAEPRDRTITLPAQAAGTTTIALLDAGVAGGTSDLRVTATTPGGTSGDATVHLRHSVNLALNGLGTPRPAASASSRQDTFPPSLAVDGSPGTFWVSGGASSATGPKPTNPVDLSVDFGAPVRVGKVVMTPRAGYGPKAYSVEVSDDGSSWRQVADEPSAPNGMTTTTIPATTARALRLRITDSWDRVRPARNVQVAELEVGGPDT